MYIGHLRARTGYGLSRQERQIPRKLNFLSGMTADKAIYTISIVYPYVFQAWGRDVVVFTLHNRAKHSSHKTVARTP